MPSSVTRPVHAEWCDLDEDCSCGRVIKLHVGHLYIVPEEVEISTTCICGADLSKPGALKHTEFALVERLVHFEDGAIEWTDNGTPYGYDAPQVSDGSYGIELSCAACRARLVSSVEREVEDEDLRAALRLL